MTSGWVTTQFGELAHLVKGVSYSSDDYCDPDEGFVFLTIKCVSKSGGFKRDGIKYFKGRATTAQLLGPGDVLIANTDLTRAGDIVGAPIVVPPFDGATVTMSMDLSQVVEDRKAVDRQFLYYLLMTDKVRRFMKDHASGSTVLHLQTRAVPSLVIDIPRDTAEQAKIAEVLSTVDRAIEQTEALIAKQQRIKTGLMQDLLTRGIDEHGNLRSEQTHEFKDSPLGRIPVEWEALPLERMTRADSPITYGVVQPGREDENGVLFVRGGDIYQGEIKLVGLRTITKTVSESYRRTLLRGGELLMSLVGYPGEVAVVPPSLAGANIARQAALIRLADSFAPHYVMYYLLSTAGKRQVLGSSLGSAQQVVNLKELKTVVIPLPKPAEQAVICDHISDAFRHQSATLTTLRKLQAIKTGLMQDLLTGDRRVTALLESQEEVIDA